MEMGREHFYKAKRVNWKELPKEEWWVEGCLLIDYVSGQYFIHANGNSVNESVKVNEEGCLKFFAYEVEPETVCEYTQMTDINKNKIWENDIVSVEHTRYEKEIEEDYMLLPETVEYTRNYAIEFVNKGGHCGYRCRNKSIHFAISGNTVYNHKIAVIGNIFDNPELLEGGEAE